MSSAKKKGGRGRGGGNAAKPGRGKGYKESWADQVEAEEAQMEVRESTYQKGAGASRAGTTRQNLGATLLTIAAASSQTMTTNSPQQQSKSDVKVDIDSSPSSSPTTPVSG